MLIVDDHDIVREGLKQIVLETGDIIVGGEARTGAEAMERVRSGKWDVVILDLNLPDRPGLDVLAQIQASAPELPVLILSMHQQVSYAARVLKGVADTSAKTALASTGARIRRSRRGALLRLHCGRLAFGSLWRELHATDCSRSRVSDSSRSLRQAAARHRRGPNVRSNHRRAPRSHLAKMGLKNKRDLQYAIEHGCCLVSLKALVITYTRLVLPARNGTSPFRRGRR